MSDKEQFDKLGISLLVSGILVTALVIFGVGFYIESRKKKK